MSVYTNIVCDNKVVCNLVQTATFESIDETWGQMLEVLVNAGWKIKVENGIVMKSICPKCAKRGFLAE